MTVCKLLTAVRKDIVWQSEREGVRQTKRERKRLEKHLIPSLSLPISGQQVFDWRESNHRACLWSMPELEPINFSKKKSSHLLILQLSPFQSTVQSVLWAECRDLLFRYPQTRQRSFSLLWRKKKSEFVGKWQPRLGVLQQFLYCKCIVCG